MLGRGLDGLVEVGALKHVEAGDLLLRLGERAVRAALGGSSSLPYRRMPRPFISATQGPTGSMRANSRGSTAGSVQTSIMYLCMPAPLPEPGEGKTRYLMFVCTDPAVDPQEFAHIEPVDPWVAEMDGRGVRLYGSELEPPGSARTVRVREKHAIVTDGPFAETKEQIAGFDVLECADLDEAIEVGCKHPMARLGILEVRPFWPFGADLAARHLPASGE